MKLKQAYHHAANLWWYSCLFISIETLIIILLFEPAYWLAAVVIFIAGFISGVPAFLIMTAVIFHMKKTNLSIDKKLQTVLFSCLFCALFYTAVIAIAAELFFSSAEGGSGEILQVTHAILLLVFLSGVVFSFLTQKKSLRNYFSPPVLQQNFLQNTHMEQKQLPSRSDYHAGNNIFTKAAITGCLVLILMLPMLLISNLVKERKERNESVVKEVSSRWAGSQTLTGPFIYVPYQTEYVSTAGKKSYTRGHFWLLPEDLEVTGNLTEMIRKKSIYKVMLYRTTLHFKGNVKLQVPEHLKSSVIEWQNARVCVGISDFRGIEESLVVTAGDKTTELSPGLPADDLIRTGLSAPVNLAGNNTGNLLNFDVPMQIRGSEKLHFIPLSGNSRFNIQSGWHSPSFDGKSIPVERKVNNQGFNASWTFNRANLPFTTALSNVSFDPQEHAFGVTLMQPTDQYVKTDRCIKYAVLFIGLSFALFFIIELMQKKALHPVQYTLIGLALIIFYTLLLSVSELIEFDYAYALASAATIGLITWYSAIHFRKKALALLLFCAMSALYGFIFVLIRLEDSSLLFGSIGLFVVLAAAMHFSRRINWYGNKEMQQAAVLPQAGLASYE